jgi:hypothetical protein
LIEVLLFKGNLNQLHSVSGLPEKILECINSVKKHFRPQCRGGHLSIAGR